MAAIATLAVLPSLAFAVAPGGPDCGWGNMLFKSNSGLGPHLGASLTNGTSGNATFGMSSGTNGCSPNGTLTYGGISLLAQVMDEFSEDVARGEGDALDAIALTLGIDVQDRATFAQLTHDNFSTLFPNENVTAQEVMASIQQVMKNDARLSKYAA
ncbi:MAG: DUF3015 domain-containing protein [Gammaproteobacteria bacterium]|nr:DUF3015 domain-containing protein [Gammaproteobacteria bacterium]MBQ0838364.1 DUF3015 domain-containing protein [Gammaproteobacteria bacterium]